MQDTDTVDRFITRWSKASGSERANCQLFVTELCAMLGLPQPDPASDDTGLTPDLTTRIRTLAEPLDAHRKAQQAAHPDLTLTGMYNVLKSSAPAKRSRPRTSSSTAKAWCPC